MEEMSGRRLGVCRGCREYRAKEPMECRSTQRTARPVESLDGGGWLGDGRGHSVRGVLNDPSQTVLRSAPSALVSPRAGRATGLLRPPRLRTSARSDWAQLVRFCVVGGSGFAINLAVFGTLTSIFDVHHIPAAIAAFCVALASNFTLNKYWTFCSPEGSGVVQAFRYTVVSLAALGLNLGVLQLLVGLGVREIAAQSVAILTATPISFLFNRRWSFC
jgi:putative flippase GtrA